MPILTIVGPLFAVPGYIFLTDLAWGAHMPVDWTNTWFMLGLIAQGLGMVLPPDIVQKLYITLCLGIALWGGRKVASQFLVDWWLIWIVGLFALFNPFVYDRAMYGQFGVIMAMGLMLAGAGFLLEYIREQRLRSVVAGGICFAFAIQSSPHFLFFIASIGLAAIPLILSRVENWKTGLISLAKASAVIVGLTLVLNVNWIAAGVIGISGAGDLVGDGITKLDLAAFQTSGKDTGEVVANVAMMSGFWGKDQFRYRDLTTVEGNWGRSFLLLVPLMLWGLVAALRRGGRERTLAISLSILFIIALVLAAGIRIPIGKEVTHFLFDNLPLYKGMREPQKWVSVIVLAYLVFLSWGIKEFFARTVIARNDAIMKAIIAGVIVMQAPFLLFGFAGQAKPTPYPQDWHEANEFISNESQCAGSILFLPWHNYMSFSWTNGIVANPANMFFDCPVIQGSNMEWAGIYDNSKNATSAAVVAWLHGGKTDLLRNETFNIRYVILAKELDWKMYQGIALHPDLEFAKETETLIVYRVKKERGIAQ